MHLTVRQMALTAMMAALISVLAPIAIPLAGGVPVSLATLAVMLTGALLKEKLGTLATLIYILIGMIGLPVFAGYSAGAAIVFGMTGGYIIGYLPLAYITGLVYRRYSREGTNTAALAAGMVLGTVVLYALGTAWFMKSTGMTLSASLAACVIPFLPGDVLKMAVVAVLAPRLENSVSHVLAASH